ncbi:MAG: hypothetical protein JKY66_07675 [Spongiibacteraceae bacterium]|nr:hypothetical protein [Spongiibacteraceae bacterium]
MMAKKLLVLLVLFPMMAFAQMGEMSEQQRQQLMENVGDMQACFAKIDQSALQEMAVLGRAMQAEIQALCSRGKRQAALDATVKFAKKYRTNKQMSAMRECGEKMAAFIPDLPAVIEGLNVDNAHVCDSFEN